MIEFTQGDLLASPADIRVNTVNCLGVMGAGVARAFKQRYPEMFEDYRRACKEGAVRPGHLHVWRPLHDDWIINFPTKRDWRDSSRYEDIDAGLEALRTYLQPLGAVTVALPALGCGHGGLDWSRVSQMIQQKLGDLPAHLRVFGPADSRRAGRQPPSELTQEEIASAERLGYKPIKYSNGRIFFSTAPIDLERQRWMALLPSRRPGEREQKALRAVANEIARHKLEVSVALVHVGRESEEIARLFSDVGVGVVLLVPFGVLTRRSVARLASHRASGSIVVLSSSAPNTKWAKPLFLEAMDLLRERAGATLLSDPVPEWLFRRSNAWLQRVIYHLRYEGVSDEFRALLAKHGAQSIGRRSDNGAPNLDTLLSPWNQKKPARFAHEPELPIASATSRLALDLLAYPPESWVDLLSLLQEAHPEHLLLSAGITDTAIAAAVEERLSKLRLRKSQTSQESSDARASSAESDAQLENGLRVKNMNEPSGSESAT